MLKAIFYARFHPERGPSVIHQYPPNSIIASNAATQRPLLNYSDISSYIIAPYEICNHPLSICAAGYRVLGYPVSLEDAKYARNRFTFNVCFVLDEDADTTPWGAVVRKAASFLRAIEEDDGMLQAEEDLVGLKWAGEEGYPAVDIGFVHGLLRDMYRQLNAYGEACVRINDFHTLNLRLVNPKPTAPNIRAWDVPLLTRPLPSPDEWTWDITLQRIHPHINGIKHIQRIADDADVELRLVKKAVQELVYHERVLLLDIFHFQAIYALTADFAAFVEDEKMLEECCAYVATSEADNLFKSDHLVDFAPATKDTIIELYRGLNPGFGLRDFCLSNERKLYNIDIRRFITFGVIKGFLRRVHKYPLAVDSRAVTPQLGQSSNGVSMESRSFEDTNVEIDRAWKKAALSSGWPTPPTDLALESLTPVAGAGGDHFEGDERLQRFLDGKNCIEEICVSLRMVEKKVVQKLKSGKFGEVVLICK